MSETISQSTSSVDKQVILPQSVPLPQKGENPTAKSGKNDLSDLVLKFETQKRHCWLCTKIAGALKSGKEPSEEDKWHFSTCVNTWENIFAHTSGKTIKEQ